MIKDLGELSKFLKLCRKQGVKEIKFGECSVIFGEMAQRRTGDAQEEDDEILTDEPTMEQLMFLSAGGVPPP